MTLTLRQHFLSLPGKKEKEIYRRWERERRKLHNFCHFALNSLNPLAERDRGRSVLTERGDHWYAARKAGHNNFYKVVVLLSPDPPVLVSFASHPHKQFFYLFHITLQTCINLHHFKTRFSLSLQLVSSAISFSPFSLSFLILLPTYSEPGVSSLWHPSLIFTSQFDYPVYCYNTITAMTAYKLPVEFLAPHFHPQTSLWKMKKPFILQ